MAGDRAKEKFTMPGGEIFPTSDQDPNEPIRFLKKRHFFTEAGIVISPHEKYPEELLKLYGLEGKKSKSHSRHGIVKTMSQQN